MNEDNKHFVSPFIFHDESLDEFKKNKIKYDQTVFATILKNPILLLIFVIFGYYIYPSLWKKDYFMALSEDFNNLKLVDDENDLYDYINYRRGLYVSVRSNFS